MAHRGFVPPSKSKQLSAIGLSGTSQQLDWTELYDRVPKRKAQEFWDSLRSCLDPSGDDWEDLDSPEESEWLESMLHKTPDQSFKDYVASRPNRPSRSRNVLYLLPICDASELQAPAYPKGPWPSWSVLQAAAETFFAPLRVQTLPPVPMAQLRPRPESRMGSWGVEQWHAGTALTALEARVPRDAYGLMAVTMCDLYPRPEWNFVYGLARLTQRVGIFSFVRHTPSMKPSQAPEARLGAHLLYRSLKTLLHEIGHMFGLKHCTWYNCLMRGSNGEGVEHQRNPLDLCPVCLRKLHWNIGFDIRDRYAGLLKIYQEYAGVSEEFLQDCNFYQLRLARLDTLPDGATMNSEMQPHDGLRFPVPQKEARAVSSGLSGRQSSQNGVNKSASTAVVARRATRRDRSLTGVAAKNASRIVQPHLPACDCCIPSQASNVEQQRKFNMAKAQSLLEELNLQLEEHDRQNVSEDVANRR